MEIKIVLVVAVICSLCSLFAVSSGMDLDGRAVGKAGYNSQFPPSYNCPNVPKEDYGKFYAAINPTNPAYSCGTAIFIRCNDKPYCKEQPNNPLAVRIVDKCIPQFCPGADDMILSKAAFDELAATTGSVIEVSISING